MYAGDNKEAELISADAGGLCFSVILAQRGSPGHGQGSMTSGRGNPGFPSFRWVRQHPVESPTHVSAANPAERIAAEKEEQGSGQNFRRKAEAELNGLCDDAGAWQYVVVLSATNRGIPARSARMTAYFQHPCRYHGATIRGILRSLAQALNGRKIFTPAPSE